MLGLTRCEAKAKGCRGSGGGAGVLGADEAVSADEGAGNVGGSCDRGEAGGVDGSCREEAVLGARWRACTMTGAVSLQTGKSPARRLQLVVVAISDDSTNCRFASILEIYTISAASKS